MSVHETPPEGGYPADRIGPFERTVLRGHGRAGDAPGEGEQGKPDDAPDPPLTEEPVAEGYEGADLDPFERTVLRGHGRAAQAPASDDE